MLEYLSDKKRELDLIHLYSNIFNNESVYGTASYAEGDLR